MLDDKVLVLVALVRPGDPPSKCLMPLAETMCAVARERGVTEVKLLVDHNLRPKVKVSEFKKQVINPTAYQFKHLFNQLLKVSP